MLRLATYLMVMVGSITFWGMELLLNYKDYVGNSPFDLTEKFQRAFIVQRNQLLLAEFGFPLLMLVALLVLLIFKFAARSVRIPLVFVMFLGTEFWVWRSYFFDGRMANLYLQSEFQDPTMVMPNDFKLYMIAFGVVTLVLLLLRERPLYTDEDALHERLRRSLRRRKWNV